MINQSNITIITGSVNTLIHTVINSTPESSPKNCQESPRVILPLAIERYAKRQVDVVREYTDELTRQARQKSSLTSTRNSKKRVNKIVGSSQQGILIYIGVTSRLSYKDLLGTLNKLIDWLVHWLIG